MLRKTKKWGVGSLLTGAAILVSFSFNGHAFAATDAASSMPDISGKKVLTGYWHSWKSTGKDGYQQGSSADIALSNVNKAYNVIPVAFMKGDGINRIPSFKPVGMTDSDFRAQVANLNSQGRSVLLALGGADGHVQLQTGDEQAFADEIIRQVETYGFDGLDIDLEQTAITAGNNQTVIPAALKIVKNHYRAEGKNFLITMAPEFPYLKPDGAYATYITSLNGYYDYIAPQLYNQGGDGVWVDETNQWIAQNNDTLKKEFLYYMADSFIHGSRGFLQIPADKLVLGLPSNNDAAATGYVSNPQNVFDAFNQLQANGNAIRGIMTWSANWDEGKNKNGVSYNSSFADTYGPFLGTK
ncbi:chitinase [Listeria ilorinensis]|uniref:chitinase n=1 Tax=Listeria ilorinensis TaxID=2867439 RepID=UPI001EF56C8C|nr:chitinase [Listeria ilorinensis]